MRLTTLGLAALCALPAGADYPKLGLHKDFRAEAMDARGIGAPSGIEAAAATETAYMRPVLPKYRNLTQEVASDTMEGFAESAEDLREMADDFECRRGQGPCWERVSTTLYRLENQMDVFDTALDKTSLDRSWTCKEECRLACSYGKYAEAIIAALNHLADATRVVEGELDKYIVTAVNSLRSADYTFVYELVRRMSCDRQADRIMKTQGAADGSTGGSIQEAFKRFVKTPYVTGEDYAGDDSAGEENAKSGPPVGGGEVVELSRAEPREAC